MTDFIVTITDPEQLAGITWAREQYNASLPPPPPDPLDPPPDTVTGAMSMPPPMAGQQSAPPLATDEEYVQHIMEQASISYADQKLRKEYQDHYENAQAEADARRKKLLEPAAKREPKVEVKEEEEEKPRVPRRK